MPYSVLTIAHNRDDHLNQLLRGVEQQTIRPLDVIVVFMNQPSHPRYDGPLNVRTFDIAGDDGLPLAAARNRAADEALSDALIFLDVDCIPAPDFAATLLAGLESRRGLVMATPRYLERPIDPKRSLDSQSLEHPARCRLVPGQPIEPSMFWSLCFAICAPQFAALGGFDETFVGYGGEDTDFARKYDASFGQIELSSAVAYHQFHPTFRPPLNHFDEIVRNARIFRAKWDEWPMTGWLLAFSKLGLIEWSEHRSRLDVIKRPTSAQIEMAKSKQLFA